MRKNHLDCFNVLIIFLLLLLTYSKAASYRKSNNTRNNLFRLTLIHINDFHARFEETNDRSLECKSETNDICIGDYARMVSVIKRLQKTRTNPIYLNAGDNFSGTIWYTFGTWNVTQYFLNMLKADVMVIMNLIMGHVLFVDTIETPIVLANVDLSDEPQLHGKLQNSTIIVRDGRKIGIICIIWSDVNTISRTGNIQFLDEIETVRREAGRLENEGVDIIVVLSHSGIDVDLRIAQEAGSKVDVIVGGHTHTFMYSGESPGPDKPLYDYPAVVEHENGHKVLVTQASCFSKYVGDLTVYFNEAGEAVRWIGQPIFLGPNITPDPRMLEELKQWGKQFHEISRQEISATDIELSGKENCRYAECTMGDVIADAYMSYYLKNNSDSKMTVAFIQAGGIRVSLPKGSQHLWEAMEQSVSVINEIDTIKDHMLQISGMKMVVNATEPVGNRLISIHIHCEQCSPVQYIPINLDQMYGVITSEFLANGGNGYALFPRHKQNQESMYVADNEALSSYFKSMPRLENVDTGRIIVFS